MYEKASDHTLRRLSFYAENTICKNLEKNRAHVAQTYYSVGMLVP